MSSGALFWKRFQVSAIKNLFNESLYILFYIKASLPWYRGKDAMVMACTTRYGGDHDTTKECPKLCDFGHSCFTASPTPYAGEDATMTASPALYTGGDAVKNYLFLEFEEIIECDSFLQSYILAA